ncbi:T9SS type A sorting domain-containing protein [Pricia mediterranea]|uniref:T9SS type A sorting domain-containing protein n=1 Tax=Pricia mediterranea TaxID=3076079 RepID=UPI003D77487F
MELFKFDSTGPHEIQVTGLHDYNSVSISGITDCQGKVEDVFNLSESVYVYPIITKDKVFIHGIRSKTHVKVYDMAGRIIMEKDIGSDTNEILNLAAYGTGMYPIKITTRGNTETFKIIKQ